MRPIKGLSPRPSWRGAVLMLCQLGLLLYSSTALGNEPLDEVYSLRGEDPAAAVARLDELLEQGAEAATLAEYHLLRGQIQRDLGELDEAEADALAAAEQASRLAAPVLEGRALRLKGTVAAEQGDMGTAIGHFFDARDLLTGTDGEVHLARVILALGATFAMLEEYEEALPYYREALALAESLDDADLKFGAVHNISIALSGLGDQAQALDYHRRALMLAKASGSKGQLAQALATFCGPLIEQGRLEEAEAICFQARALINELGLSRIGAGIEMSLGDLALAQGDEDAALSQYEKALALSRDRVPVVKRDALPKLAELEEQRGNPERALAYLKDYIQTREDFIQEDRRRELMAQAVRHELSEREQEIELLQLDRELQAVTLQRRNWMLVGSLLGLVVLSLFVVLVWRHYGAKARQQAELAGRDPLTGLLNRRGFFLLAGQESARAYREGYPLIVAMADIDHFKPINDQYGHGVGDEILKEVANRLQAGVRGFDSVVRWGGEEFLLLFSQARPAMVETIVERLRKEIAERPIPASVGDIPITLTFGIAEVKNDIDHAIEEADRALYQGKAAGRNQLVLAKAGAAS